MILLRKLQFNEKSFSYGRNKIFFLDFCKKKKRKLEANFVSIYDQSYLWHIWILIFLFQFSFSQIFQIIKVSVQWFRELWRLRLCRLLKKNPWRKCHFPNDNLRSTQKKSLMYLVNVFPQQNPVRKRRKTSNALFLSTTFSSSSFLFNEPGNEWKITLSV